MTKSASILRRRVALAVFAAAGFAGFAHAERQPQPVLGAKYDVALRLDMFGEVSTPHVVTAPGERIALSGEHGGKPWRMEFTIQRSSGESVRVDGKISSGETTLAAPVMVGSLGQRIAMRTSDGVNVAMIVKEIAR